MKYGTKVRVKSGFYEGMEGIVFETDGDSEFSVKLNEGVITQWINENHLEVIEEGTIKENLTVEENKQKYDFSKFVGRCGNDICIKGNKYLRSFFNGDLVYGSVDKAFYADILTYTETTLDKLEVGDVFLLKKDNSIFNDLGVSAFGIFIGKDTSGTYKSYYLLNQGKLEYVNTYNYLYDEKVIKFNRY